MVRSMFRPFIAIAMALSLTACVTASGTTPGPQVRPSVQTAIDLIRDTCGFVTASATVIALFNSGLTDYVQLAAEVCTGLKSRRMMVARSNGTVVPVYGMVRGVPIRGRPTRQA